MPYWPLSAAFGDVWAYDVIVLLTFVLAGAIACWWLRALDASRPAALAGGVIFCLMPYRVGPATGHLIGLIAFLLPALLLALERRRYVVATLALAAVPLSAQLHLALRAIPPPPRHPPALPPSPSRPSSISRSARSLSRSATPGRASRAPTAGRQRRGSPWRSSPASSSTAGRSPGRRAPDAR